VASSFGSFSPAVDDKEQTSQTSRLVWWMIKSGPVFCSLAEGSKISHFKLFEMNGSHLVAK